MGKSKPILQRIGTICDRKEQKITNTNLSEITIGNDESSLSEQQADTFS